MPGLVGHDAAGDKRFLVGGREQGKLMDIDTHAMPERVAHLVFEARLGKLAFGERMHLRACHTRLDACGNPFVCPAYGLVDAYLLVACPTDAHGACRVRAVSAHACTEVEDDEVALLELTL